MPGMIVAPQPLAVEHGARVLAAGGNAFDAALTCAAIQFLVDPHSCGIGGYLVLNYWMPDSTTPPEILDAPATAGSGVDPAMWNDMLIRANPDGWGYFLKDKVNEIGYQSICTPGMVRGIQAIHERFCSWELARLLEPAIQIAEHGWAVGHTMATRWRQPASFYEAASHYEKLQVTPDAQRIYLDSDGNAPTAGQELRNPDYGRTLYRLAHQGPNDFYQGSLAAEITADLSANGSAVTADDLANYAVRCEPAIVTDYRDCTIITNQAPHGGPTLAAILNILECYELKSLQHNSAEYIYLVSMAMKAAFADRNRHLADPQFVDVPVDWMTSKQRAQEWQTVIDAQKPIDVGRGSNESPDTTQVTVVDQHGHCVSLTHSLGSSGGVISPGLGFMYNNSMVNFDPVPGRPNSIAAGKGRTTGMTPTIVLKDNQPVLVLGAPGATRIITSVLQVILNHLEFGMPIGEAVHAARFDCQGDMIKCQARIPEYTCEIVRRKHPITHIPQSHGGLALVHAIAIDPITKQLSGAADTGADGMPLLVP